MTRSARLDGIVVFKMSGSGNDFVFVDGRATPVGVWSDEHIRWVCSRRTGVGADGLVVLEPGSRPGAVRFHFFNRDGSRGAMCGNGALCATRLASWLELAPPTDMVLETDAGEVSARCLEGAGEMAQIGLSDAALPVVPDIRLEDGERSVHVTMVGVDHLVVVVDDLERPGLMERGRVLRSHPALGAAGANVNFAASRDGEWRMRTFERGVEAETLACGTGAVAIAAVLCGSGDAALPLAVRTASGSMLEVSGVVRGGAVSGPRLTGEGRLVYRAVLGGNEACRSRDDASGFV
jgi:diaminopimelate epimerase